MTRPDLATLVDSDHTVLVTQECQNGVIGDGGPLPQLAEAAQRTVVPNGGACSRPPGPRASTSSTASPPAGPTAGSNTNARLFAGVRKKGASMEAGSDATQVVPELGRRTPT